MAGNFAASVFIVLLVAPITVYGATHNVDWSLGTDYSSWATKAVEVGDTIVFTYGGSHSVDVVSKDAYSSCDASSATYTDSSGKTSYTLKSEGAVYFICGTPGHCPGMQLQLNVKAASTTTPSTSTTTTSPSTTSSTPASTSTTTTTPSTTTTTTGSKNGASTHGLSWMVFGVSLVLGTLISFMG